MLISCTAILENDMQMENLCQCIKILGGSPCVDGCEVTLAYEGSKKTADRFIDLFEQYPLHGISTIE